MFLAGSRARDGADAHVVQRVVGLAVTVVVLRRRAVAACGGNAANALAPGPVRAGAGAELANTFLARRSTRLRAAVDAGSLGLRHELRLLRAGRRLKLRDDGRFIAGSASNAASWFG